MNRKTKSILSFIVVVIIAIVAATAIILNLQSRLATNPPASPNEPTDAAVTNPLSQADYSKLFNSVIPPNSDNGNIGDHVRGKADSKITVIEYADVQCPGCAALMMFMPDLYDEYDDSVAFIFRHYPLSMHQNAGRAAVATESAGRQGYFWPMLEALYSDQSIWATKTGEELENTFVSVFESVAPSGDKEKFRADLEDPLLVTKVTFDHDLGKTYHNISATPSVFINGKPFPITDYTTLLEFRQALRDEINRLLAE